LLASGVQVASARTMLPISEKPTPVRHIDAPPIAVVPFASARPARVVPSKHAELLDDHPYQLELDSDPSAYGNDLRGLVSVTVQLGDADSRSAIVVLEREPSPYSF
jgi:hypothetical protein